MKIQNTARTALAVTVVAVFASGCASTGSMGGSNYSANDTQRAITTIPAWVVSARPVKIDGPDQGIAQLIGIVGGAILGNAIGSTIGSGKGETVARGVGTVGGAVGGSVAASALTKVDGFEITIRLRSGAEQTFVQQAEKDVTFTAGMPVRLSYVGGKARVASAPEGSFGPMPAASAAMESVAPLPSSNTMVPPPGAYGQSPSHSGNGPAGAYPSQAVIGQGPAGPFPSATAPQPYFYEKTETFTVYGYTPYVTAYYDEFIVVLPSGGHRVMRVPHEGVDGMHHVGDRVRFEAPNGKAVRAHHVR